MKKRALLTVVVLLFGMASAIAHDYWLQPESFFLPVGEAVSVRLHVGDRFASEQERPFQKKPTVRFELLAAGRKHDLAAEGQDGKTPAGRVTVKAPGTCLIAMERAPQLIRLEADKFNRYLAEEGLELIQAMRKKAGEEDKEGRERYSRYLKCLVQAGEQRDDTFKQVLGQRLEIVPEANPYQLKTGDSLPVRVLFEGKPLAGVRLTAYHRSDGRTASQALITSETGQATVRLDRAGPWLVRLVHMRRCGLDTEADWESFWGALTFGIK